AISITAKDSVKHAVITGSPVNDDNAKLTAMLKPAVAKMEALQAEYASKTDEDRKNEAYMQTVYARSEKIEKEMQDLSQGFINSNPNSYVALNAFRSVLGYDIDPTTAEPAFNKFSAALKSTALGKSIQTSIEGAKKSQVGIMAT